MITQKELHQIATLHIQSLPESSVTKLGYRFALSFYRYIQSSKKEWIEIVKKDSQIVGVGVISLNSRSLPLRLLFNTSLLIEWLKKNLHHFPKNRMRSQGTVPSGPELILLYVDSQHRNTGLGARLLEQVEKRLLANGRSEYWVKTESKPDNLALLFYKKKDFYAKETLTINGINFEIFKKKLTPENSNKALE